MGTLLTPSPAPTTPAEMAVADPEVAATLKADREAAGLDRWDEVWNGVYIIMPLPNNEHQELVLDFAAELRPEVKARGGRIFPGCNVSDVDTRADPETDWRTNYRCPDLAAFLPGNPAEDRGSHCYLGPDFAAEIVSRGDRGRQKLAFYAAAGVRELLILDREPTWRLELFRRDGDAPASVAVAGPGGDPLRTEVVPAAWAVTAGPPPGLSVTGGK